MNISLNDRVAVISGGSRGIGAAIASAYAGAGAKVVIVSRKADSLAETADRINTEVGSESVIGIAANSADPAGLERVLDYCKEAFGYVDVLVNCAAANPYFGPLSGIGTSAVRKILEVNLESVQLWISQFWAHFWSTSELTASCINIASIGGMSVESGIGFYNVSKAGVIHLTRQFAYELSPRVRVNSISPGLVRTDFARALWENGEETIAKALPLRRIGEPGDIAGPALFLASDMSSWITGINLVVDGGALIRGLSLH